MNMDDNNFRGYRIDFRSKEGLFHTLYDFLRLPELTNPEVTFFTSRGDNGEAQTLSFSRDAKYADEKLPDEMKWQELTSLQWLEGIMCVGGTNKEDTRRVVVLYVAKEEYRKSVMISFPNTTNGRLNSKEAGVLRFFDGLPETVPQS